MISCSIYRFSFSGNLFYMIKKNEEGFSASSSFRDECTDNQISILKGGFT